MFPPYTWLAVLALSNSCSAKDVHHGHLHKRVAAHYTTITKEIVSTVTQTVPLTINTNIDQTGVFTIIPGSLTMNIVHTPAYLYLETESLTTSLTTIYSTTTSMLGTTGSTAKTAMVVNSSTIKLPTSTSSATHSTTSSTAPHPSSSSAHSTTPSTASQPSTSTIPSQYLSDNQNCGGLSQYCGSLRECVNARCYDLNNDSNNCGTVGNVCPNQPVWQCHGRVCVNVQTDVNNCGQTSYYCGEGYGCSAGKCVNIQSDSTNCGAVGTVCKTGTGCSSGKCIDTTSDPNNCSDVGYACPKTVSKCVNSVCIA